MHKTLLPVAVLLVTSAAAPMDRQPAPFDPGNLQWTRLELKARKLIFTARSEVRLRSVASPEAAALWIDSPEGVAVQAAGPRVLEITIESSGLGKESTNTVWFNPGRGDAIDYFKQRHGKNGYRKDARFADRGTFVLRRAPIDRDEAERPFPEWSKIEKFSYPYPQEVRCRGISDPAVLFYMLSARTAAELRDVCVFSSKQMVPLAIEEVGSEKLRVDYDEIRAAETHRRSGEVDAVRVAVRPAEGTDDFELLGLDGAIEVLLEKTTRVPLEVRGRIGGLGGVKIKLTAVELGSL